MIIRHRPFFERKNKERLSKMKYGEDFVHKGVGELV